MDVLKEPKVSFELAQVLHELEFDGECTTLYNEKGDVVKVGYWERDSDMYNISCDRDDLEEGEILRPTLSLAQKWVFENFGIWISIFHQKHSENKHFGYLIKHTLVEYKLFQSLIPHQRECELQEQYFENKSRN